MCLPGAVWRSGWLDILGQYVKCLEICLFCLDIQGNICGVFCCRPTSRVDNYCCGGAPKAFFWSFSDHSALPGFRTLRSNIEESLGEE